MKLTLFCNRYTSKETMDETVIYGIALQWPKNNVLILDSSSVPVTESTVVTLLGYDGILEVFSY